MKKLLLFIMITLVACSNKKNNNVEITNLLSSSYNIEKGDKLPLNIMLLNKRNIMVSPSQFYDCFKIINNNNEFYISFDENNIIRSIFTYDSSFITQDSIKIGMKFSDVAKLSKQNPYLIKGWAYVIPLKSGWIAAFEISNYHLNIMSCDSTVKWLYK